jgi:hypothetical protein
MRGKLLLLINQSIGSQNFTWLSETRDAWSIARKFAEHNAAYDEQNAIKIKLMGSRTIKNKTQSAYIQADPEEAFIYISLLH